MEQRYAFVLRIWLVESMLDSGRKGSGLRGTLQSVDAAEPSHFTSLRQLNELIELALQQQDTSSPTTD